MNKGIVYAGIGLGVAAIGYFLYRYMQTPTQNYATTSLNPNTQAGPFTTDPHQSYPFQANVPPRVDNSNQPWAGNNRAAITQVSNPQVDVNLSNVNMIASFAKSANEIATNFSDLYQNLGVADWFNNKDASNLEEDWSF